jgi:D-proline reductase (dithiol) PrdB
MYEDRGPFPGEEGPVWAPFEKRLAAARIAMLTSAGLFLKSRQPSFDLEREQNNPEWGDPSWRSIPANAEAADIGVAHLHINDEDIKADPEIALPTRMLDQLVAEGVVGSATSEHLSVMGYQDRGLGGWRNETLPELVAKLRDEQADGLILAPA